MRFGGVRGFGIWVVAGLAVPVALFCQYCSLWVRSFFCTCDWGSHVTWAGPPTNEAVAKWITYKIEQSLKDTNLVIKHAPRHARHLTLSKMRSNPLDLPSALIAPMYLLIWKRPTLGSIIEGENWLRLMNRLQRNSHRNHKEAARRLTRRPKETTQNQMKQSSLINFYWHKDVWQ